jgi:hypothetical protein
MNTKLYAIYLYLIAMVSIHAQTQWEVKVDYESLFPSYIVATATIDKEKLHGKLSENYFGDSNGQVGCEVIAPSNNCRFTLEISSNKFIRKSSFSGVLKTAGEKYRIYPEIEYDYDALYSVQEPMPENITLTLKLNEDEILTKKVICQVRSINECIWGIKNDDGTVYPLTWMFGAYVNENHPLIDKILKEALDLRLVNSFDGYQNGPEAVYRQVCAVWQVLQRHGIKYSSITSTSSGSKKILSQYVRPLEQSLINTQANCVDGSVLLASIFSKIGLHTYLILVPGHCYMGVTMDEKQTMPLTIETTVIGNIDHRLLTQNTTEAIAISIESFMKSVEIGDKNFKESIPFFGKKPLYYAIYIKAARSLGIHPIKSKP